MNLINQIMQEGLKDIFPAAVLFVMKEGRVLLDRSYGWLDPESKKIPASSDTLFDLDSLTHLFTVSIFMELIEVGKVTLDTPLSDILPEFKGERPVLPYEDPFQAGKMVHMQRPGQNKVNAAGITFRQLLTHTSGLPAWRPLYTQSDPDAARRLVYETFFSYVPGEQILYSDIGMLLLGFAVEKLTRLPLEQAIQDYICLPLGLWRTTYRPLDGVMPFSNLTPTEFYAWNQRYNFGEVYEKNTAFLGGVSGQAGIFATAPELAYFGQTFLYASMLKAETIRQMTSLQAQEGNIRQGLGFRLWSPDPESSSYPLGQRAFGLTGLTGTSLWMEPEKGLVITLLTNHVYYGRQAEKIEKFRLKLHEVINQHFTY